MLNSKENEKKSRPSGQENQTVILGLEVTQQTRGEYNLEANGKTQHDVNQNDYIVIKAYDNSKKNVKEQAEIGE